MGNPAITTQYWICRMSHQSHSNIIFLRIEQTCTCSYFDDRTQTHYYKLWTDIEHSLTHYIVKVGNTARESHLSWWLSYFSLKGLAGTWKVYESVYYVGHLFTISSCVPQSFLYKVSIIVETEKGGKEKKEKYWTFSWENCCPKTWHEKTFCSAFFSPFSSHFAAPLLLFPPHVK